MKKFFLTLLTATCFWQFSFAQSIKGKVIDAISRQPLETVSVAGTGTTGTLTDQYGNFSLDLDKSTRLTISYVGYKPLTVAVDDKTEIKIELEPDAVNLKDVVILTNNHFTRFNSISKIDLALKPVRNTQELLRLVPGLFIAQHAGGGKAEQIFLRGFDCDHGTDVQVSVDGLPVNMVSHAHGQGYADSHFIIPETINNIDFGAGPYYTQHGNLNTAGYVAFSTYNNIPNSRIQLEAGRYNTFRTLAIIDLLKKNKDRQSAYVAGDFYYTDGPSAHKQDFNRFNLFGKYNLAISSTTQLTASASAFKSKWDASGQVPTRAVESGLISRFGAIDPSEGGNTERYNINFIVAHHFSNGSSWENQVFYSRYIFNLYSDFTFFLTDTINGKTGVLGSTTAAVDGAWSFMSLSGSGHIDLSTVHHYSVIAEDAAGNTGKMAGGLFLTDTRNDVLDATSGVREIFAIMSDLGSDVIEGFQPASRAGSNHDVLNFSGRGISSFNQVQTIMAGNSSAIFTLTGGKKVTLTDVAPSWLTEADFRFT